MENCDGFFEAEGIPYLPSFEAAAVRAVRSADFYDPTYKKWLIMCWFDVTYGIWNSSSFDLRDSRAKMSNFLARTPYSTFEELIASPNTEEGSI